MNTQTRPINNCTCDRCTKLRHVGVDEKPSPSYGDLIGRKDKPHKTLRELGEQVQGRRSKEWNALLDDIPAKDYEPVMRHGKLDSFRLVETPQPGTPPCEDAYPGKVYFRDDAGNDHEVGHDPVSNPDHYTWHPSGVEQIVISEHMPYNLGTAIKYIWRCHHKGKTIEDLQKAKWLIEREIKRVSEMSK